MGAHPTKVGLNPILVDLMRKDVITAVAMNGAVVIHDFELAYQGHTSEEVEAEIDSGRFGMAEDTGRILNEAMVEGWQQGLGLGEAVGRYMTSHPKQFPHRRSSLLATGVQLGIPVTVHVAIGTDIIHMHPSANGEAIGGTSLRDFHHRFISEISTISSALPCSDNSRDHSLQCLPGQNIWKRL